MEKKIVKLGVLLIIVSFAASCDLKTKSTANKTYQNNESRDAVYPSQVVEQTTTADEKEEADNKNKSIAFAPPVILSDVKEPLSDDILYSIDEIHVQSANIMEDKRNVEIVESHPHTYVMVEQPEPNTEEYSSFRENTFVLAQNNPLSTFSIDVDAASYSNIRRFINQGSKPNMDAVRVEEMVNYFDYQYPQPKGSDPVYISTEIGTSPWNKDNRLVKIGLKAKEIPVSELPKSNFVFLIDVSGSMSGPTRLDLVKSSMKMLLDNLRPTDRVAIVVYANSVGVRLPSTPVSQKEKIVTALNALVASGGTSGGDGIQQAYKVAEKNFIDGGNNRIILCTDGDFNIGISNDTELERLIEQKRKSGVFLSILGYGMGNYKDKKMQTLAQAGNGNHAYIDNLQEAHKVLVKELTGTMYTLAKDVKLQVEFNPAKVQAYRLVGYETRALNKEDFNDDTKDAGEMGVGHTVTAFYEVVPMGVKSNIIPSVDPLKYQSNALDPAVILGSQELLTVKMRYKEPNGDTSKLISRPVIDLGGDKVSQDFRFASAVAMYGQLLRNSQYKGEGNYDQVIALAQKGLDYDADGYRREFIRLVESTKSLH